MVSGESVKDFDDHICGMVDVYFSGQDHNRQWLQPMRYTSSCPVRLRRPTSRDAPPTYWEDDGLGGFLWVEVRGDELVGEFYDQFAEMEFTRTITRSR